MASINILEVTRVFDSIGIQINPEPRFRTAMERKLVETWDGIDRWNRGVCKVCATKMPETTCKVLDFEIPINVCEKCGPIVTDHYSVSPKQDELVTQNPWWDENCPPNYQELIKAKRLPDQCDKGAIERVQKWTASDRKGLVLLGPSGIGKTLALWQKARDLERAGLNPVFLSAVEFARKLAVAARDLDKAEWLMKAQVLIIDDLGKEKLSAAVAPLIWEVIDARNNHRKPTLISTRFRGTDFVARFSEPILGEDIRGRIADCCTVVNFGVDKVLTASG
jgi:hypothetical protein